MVVLGSTDASIFLLHFLHYGIVDKSRKASKISTVLIARQSISYIKDGYIGLDFSEKFHRSTFSPDRSGRDVAKYRNYGTGV